jgi:hypothetical protein
MSARTGTDCELFQETFTRKLQFMAKIEKVYKLKLK